ncbi:MAG: hypothetical protein GY796_21885 [Chloroflexi bacterium]|nr:hypothetical protein [Chloroflexota bacterium]
MLLWLGKAKLFVAFLAGNHSAALLAAQKQLSELQTNLRQQRSAAGTTPDLVEHARYPATQSPPPTLSQTITHLPDHLGWGSQTVTQTIRSHCDEAKGENSLPDLPVVKVALDNTAVSPPPPPQKQTIKLFPDIAIGMLQQEAAASGRIWLLLRHLDSDGRGWHNMADIRQQLTGKQSNLKVCGWRQLRNLLRQGEGVFWQRVDGRVWLRSVTKVAAALEVSRLNLKPVALPITILTQSIGKVRAHFYAAFHSGRGKQNGKLAAPIARATIAKLTQVQERTQKRYEKIACVRTQRHFAVGSQATKQRMEERAWQHGRATFELQDFRGKQGVAGQTYIAWQLPNSYEGPHDTAPKGRQKQINHVLSDLFMQGMTGNGQSEIKQCFYANGRVAAQAYNRGPIEDIYWYDGRARTWHCLAAV